MLLGRRYISLKFTKSGEPMFECKGLAVSVSKLNLVYSVKA